MAKTLFPFTSPVKTAEHFFSPNGNGHVEDYIALASPDRININTVSEMLQFEIEADGRFELTPAAGFESKIQFMWIYNGNAVSLHTDFSKTRNPNFNNVNSGVIAMYDESLVGTAPRISEFNVGVSNVQLEVLLFLNITEACSFKKMQIQVPINGFGANNNLTKANVSFSVKSVGDASGAKTDPGAIFKIV